MKENQLDAVTKPGVIVCTSRSQLGPPVLKKPIRTAKVIVKKQKKDTHSSHIGKKDKDIQ